MVSHVSHPPKGYKGCPENLLFCTQPSLSTFPRPKSPLLSLALGYPGHTLAWVPPLYSFCYPLSSHSLPPLPPTQPNGEVMILYILGYRTLRPTGVDPYRRAYRSCKELRTSRRVNPSAAIRLSSADKTLASTSPALGKVPNPRFLGIVIIGLWLALVHSRCALYVLMSTHPTTSLVLLDERQQSPLHSYCLEGSLGRTASLQYDVWDMASFPTFRAQGHLSSSSSRFNPRQTIISALVRPLYSLFFESSADIYSKASVKSRLAHRRVATNIAIIHFLA
ncbi:hypothetical protein Hypma_010619 [Hypsizygus marmoreus]|uniref:Uncharacterized protein n=1 Tax=Hypsizygus marmoreus TaxID=39966 RepID=A0A369JLL5_HYPMA|nr:hypothetical protein Hypma_010619 [Hypsizygus marmoreus]